MGTVKRSWIVKKFAGGRYTPFNNKDAALVFAETMAKENPNFTFEVYECIANAIANVPVTVIRE